MGMDSVLEIFLFLTAFPPWRPSLASSPWTGRSAPRLRRARIAPARGKIGDTRDARYPAEQYCRCVTKAMNDSEKALNSVSKIDTVSRIVFPSTYIVINIIYWYMYLDNSERISVISED